MKVFSGPAWRLPLIALAVIVVGVPIARKRLATQGEAGAAQGADAGSAPSRRGGPLAHLEREAVYERMDRIASTLLREYERSGRSIMSSDVRRLYRGRTDEMQDPWGAAIQVRPLSNGFRLVSAGPDGRFRTSDDVTSDPKTYPRRLDLRAPPPASFEGRTIGDMERAAAERQRNDPVYREKTREEKLEEARLRGEARARRGNRPDY